MKKKSSIHQSCTLQQIADCSGFSISTVSRALAGSTRISTETRTRIVRLADKYNYRHKYSNVAIVIQSFSEYCNLLLRELQQQLKSEGFRFLIVTWDMLDILDVLPLQGAISIFSENGLEQIWDRHFSCPLVCINTHCSMLNKLYSVTSDDANAIASAVDTLYQAGHRRIAHLTIDFKAANHNAFRRQQTMEKLSAQKKFTLFARTVNDLNAYDTVETLQYLLKNNVTAVISSSETVTDMLAHAFNTLGLRIPEDLSVIGWSNGLGNQLLNWDLYVQDYRQISRNAINMLKTLINGDLPEKPELQVDYLHCPGCSIAPPAAVSPNPKP